LATCDIEPDEPSTCSFIATVVPLQPCGMRFTGAVATGDVLHRDEALPIGGGFTVRAAHPASRATAVGRSLLHPFTSAGELL
jgi:hypothetical protein